MPEGGAGHAARHLARAAFSLLVLWLVAVLGQIPYGRASGRAVLRVALRTVSGRIEVCRDRTAEELAALAPHMRQPRVCTETAPTYRLDTSLDGEELAHEEVAPGGLWRDRPLIVDRQLSVPPGLHRLSIRFAAQPDAGARAEERSALAGLPRYELDQTVSLTADRITLVTLDDIAGELRIYSRP